MAVDSSLSGGAFQAKAAPTRCDMHSSHGLLCQAKGGGSLLLLSAPGATVFVQTVHN